MESFRYHHHPHDDNQFSIELPPSHEQVKQAERNARGRPSFLRIIVRVITLAVGASILGVLAVSVAVWYSTRHDVLTQPGKLAQPGWPSSMDLKPTYALLAASGIAIAVQLLALFTLVGSVSSSKILPCVLYHSDAPPQIRRLRESRLHTLTVLLTSLAGIVVWIAVAVYFKVQELKGAPTWTLWSWSCSHTDWTNGKMSFRSMCTKLVRFLYCSCDWLSARPEKRTAS